MSKIRNTGVSCFISSPLFNKNDSQEQLSGQPPLVSYPVLLRICIQKFSARHNLTCFSTGGSMHKLAGIPDPTASFLVKKMILGVQKKSHSVDKRLPITSFWLNYFSLQIYLPHLRSRSHFSEQCFCSLSMLS